MHRELEAEVQIQICTPASPSYSPFVHLLPSPWGYLWLPTCTSINSNTYCPPYWVCPPLPVIDFFTFCLAFTLVSWELLDPLLLNLDSLLMWAVMSPHVLPPQIYDTGKGPSQHRKAFIVKIRLHSLFSSKPYVLMYEKWLPKDA